MNALGRAWLALWHMPGRAARAALRAGSLATWMQWGAGVAATGIAVGFLLVIWLGPWPAEAWSKRLDLLGQGQLAAWAVVIIALAAIAGLRLAFSGGKDGFKAGVEKDDDTPGTVVSATASVEVAAPSAEAGKD